MIEKEYIEREVAQKILKVLADYAYNVAKSLDTVPAADVQEVRHAKWYKVHEHIILADGSVKEWDNFFCSNCEEVSNCPTKYCPCCGAKIDKEENND